MAEKLVSDSPPSPLLLQQAGWPQLVCQNIGSLLSLGLFVGLGVVAGVAGTRLGWAVALATGIALVNRLNRVQLTLRQDSPETDRLYIWWRFAADWTFLLTGCTAAALTAQALAGYLLTPLHHTAALEMGLSATGLVLLLLGLSLVRGIGRLSWLWMAGLLGALVLLGGSAALGALSSVASTALASPSPLQLLKATALMSLAFFSFDRFLPVDRIRSPQRNLPQATGILLLLTALLYEGITLVALHSVGAEGIAEATDASAAPLLRIAQQVPGGLPIVAVGAVLALLGMLLTLLTRLMQQLNDMVQQRDLPQAIARSSSSGIAPRLATIAGIAVICLIWLSDLEMLWAFSAFTAFMNSAIINLAALRLSQRDRLYPRWLAHLGLLLCLVGFAIEWQIWLLALVLVVLGLIWRGIQQWAEEQSRS